MNRRKINHTEMANCIVGIGRLRDSQSNGGRKATWSLQGETWKTQAGNELRGKIARWENSTIPALAEPFKPAGDRTTTITAPIALWAIWLPENLLRPARQFRTDNDPRFSHQRWSRKWRQVRLTRTLISRSTEIGGIPHIFSLSQCVRAAPKRDYALIYTLCLTRNPKHGKPASQNVNH